MLEHNPGAVGAEASPIQVSLNPELLHRFVVQQVTALLRKDPLHVERVAATNWLSENAILHKDAIFPVLIDSYLKRRSYRDGIEEVWNRVAQGHPDYRSEVVDTFLHRQQQLHPRDSRLGFLRGISAIADDKIILKLAEYLKDPNRPDSEFIAECIHNTKNGCDNALFDLAIGDNDHARGVAHNRMLPSRQSRFPLSDIRLDVLLYFVRNPDQLEGFPLNKRDSVRAEIIRRGMENEGTCGVIVSNLSESINSSTNQAVVAGSGYVLARLKPMGANFLVSVALDCEKANQLGALSALLNANKDEPIRDSILRSIGLMDPGTRRNFIERVLGIEGYLAT